MGNSPIRHGANLNSKAVIRLFYELKAEPQPHMHLEKKCIGKSVSKGLMARKNLRFQYPIWSLAFPFNIRTPSAPMIPFPFQHQFTTAAFFL